MKSLKLFLKTFFEARVMRLILLLSIILFLGCDLGTYSKRYAERVGNNSPVTNSNNDLANELIGVAGGAELHIPKICYYKDEKGKLESVKYGPGDNENVARIPGIHIQGFHSSYLGDVKYKTKYLPFQVYFYFAKKGDYKDPKAEIKKEIRKVLKDFSWSSPKKITGDDGQEYAWTTGSEIAGMPFSVWENDSEKSENMQGRMDICLTSKEEGTLIVVFRAPTDIFGHSEEALVEGTLKSIRGFK